MYVCVCASLFLSLYIYTFICMLLFNMFCSLYMPQYVYNIFIALVSYLKFGVVAFAAVVILLIVALVSMQNNVPTLESLQLAAAG